MAGSVKVQPMNCGDHGDGPHDGKIPSDPFDVCLGHLAGDFRIFLQFVHDVWSVSSQINFGSKQAEAKIVNTTTARFEGLVWASQTATKGSSELGRGL
jgi:hypothetical protein